MVGQAWSSAHEFQSAHNLGDAEGDATWNLLKSVEPDVVDLLCQFVQCLGSVERYDYVCERFQYRVVIEHKLAVSHRCVPSEEVEHE